MCLTILAQNVFEHFVSVYKITPCTCFDVLLATFLCENLVCLCVTIMQCVFCDIAQCVCMCLSVCLICLHVSVCLQSTCVSVLDLPSVSTVEVYK